MKASTSSGRSKAVALVAAYAKHVGVHDAIHQTLDENNDRSFGDFEFHYFPDKDVIECRVYIVRSHIREWPDRAHFERQVIAGLNNPKIGGMYDRGGDISCSMKTSRFTSLPRTTPYHPQPRQNSLKMLIT